MVVDILKDIEPFRDKAGNVVLCDGSSWLVHTLSKRCPWNFDFAFLNAHSRGIARATILWARYHLMNNSDRHAQNGFRFLKAFLNSRQFKAKDLLPAILAWKNAQRKVGLEYTVHYVRDWFLYGSNQYFDGFDDLETRLTLLEMTIPGNPKGVAVMSQDPEEGPLFEVEEVALRAALERDNILSPDELVLVKMFSCLGPNPSNVAQLKEDDFIVSKVEDVCFYELRMPRVKKRLPPRSEFVPRKLEAALGKQIQDLIAHNQKHHPTPSEGRPLFWAEKPRPNADVWQEFAFHLSALEIANKLSAAVDKLRVISPITSAYLRVTCRRFRYSLATRAVRGGADEEQLAFLLDHSDLQHVGVYFRNKEVRKRLDEVRATMYGPLSKRFFGKIVENEAAAGGGPENRIMATIDITGADLAGLGTCGLGTPCSKFPPRSCYLCDKFAPWKDAPHTEFLHSVSSLTKSDPRGALQLDDVVLAIGEVVELCKK